VEEIIESEAPKAVPTSLSVSLLADGFPSIPDFNIDTISPQDAKKLLAEYLTTAWSM
jgi:hypothetical protein